MTNTLKHELKLSLAVAGLQLGLPKNWVFRRLKLDSTWQWRAMQRAGITKQLRWKILKRDNYRCYLCQGRIAYQTAWDLDHKLALVNGGDNRESNLGATHAGCNRRKGAKRL